MEEIKNQESILGNDIIIDARETFNVKDKSGNLLGRFSFDPSDIDLPRRFEKVMNYFSNLEIPQNDDLSKLYEATDEFKRQINEALNSEDAADALFCSNPFSPMNDGSLLAEKVLNAVAGIIEAKTNARIQKVNKRYMEYTKKYHK